MSPVTDRGGSHAYHSSVFGGRHELLSMFVWGDLVREELASISFFITAGGKRGGLLLRRLLSQSSSAFRESGINLIVDRYVTEGILSMAHAYRRFLLFVPDLRAGYTTQKNISIFLK